MGNDLTISNSKKWFNDFSSISAIELAEILLNNIKKENKSDVDFTMIAEMSRALFVNCCYIAATKNSISKNKEMCEFYSSVLSRVYGNDCLI